VQYINIAVFSLSAEAKGSEAFTWIVEKAEKVELRTQTTRKGIFQGTDS